MVKASSAISACDGSHEDRRVPGEAFAETLEELDEGRLDEGIERRDS